MDLTEAVAIGLFSARHGPSDPGDERKEEHERRERAPAGGGRKYQRHPYRQLHHRQQRADDRRRPIRDSEIAHRLPGACKITELADAGGQEDHRQHQP